MLGASPLSASAVRNRLALWVSNPCTWHIYSHLHPTCASFCGHFATICESLLQVVSTHNHTKIHLWLQMNSSRGLKIRTCLHNSCISSTPRQRGHLRIAISTPRIPGLNPFLALPLWNAVILTRSYFLSQPNSFL